MINFMAISLVSWGLERVREFSTFRLQYLPVNEVVLVSGFLGFFAVVSLKNKGKLA
ncbi:MULTISPECIES: hypothetical protein [unclassified Levilactobacillus]|uniref:hypothetical protein n=1 Tax=unclassified Levilactobacillus TaxID=2767918 RepID=UPI002FF1E506